MVRQTRRADRRFLPAAGGGVAKVRFPAGPGQRALPPPQQGCPSGSSDVRLLCSAAAAAGAKRATDASEGSSAEAQMKRTKQNGKEAATALSNRNKAPGSCDPATDGSGSGSEQQGASQSVGSLKVTIQQSSDSREFGRSDGRTAPALHCHVCNLTCRSLQVFQEHMSGRDHLSRLQNITQSIQLNARPLLDRGCRPQTQRWCDTCQSHFTGDVIIHRRTERHKVCKQRGRPFCPVCQRHFRTPRKFVEHIKSVEHKEQVQLKDGQEEELITLDAVGCFKDEEEVEVVEEDEDVGPSEGQGSETVDDKQSEEEEFDPQLTYGSSFVVPVQGFVCRLCNKFFYRETEARHTHCRTHTHFLNLQNHRRGRGGGGRGDLP